MRAESTVEITSDAFDVNITAGSTILLDATDDVQLQAGDDISIQAGGAVLVTSAASQDIILTSNDNIQLIAPNGDILVGGIVAARRGPGGFAFDIGPITPQILNDVTLASGSGVNFPTITVLRGIYNIKAMGFCDGGASNTSVDFLITPSAGNVQGSVVNAVRGATPSEAAVFFPAAASINFNGVLTANDFVREIDGAIEFTQDCTVAFRWDNSGNSVDIKR
jgi:hypothetical protein